MTPGREIPELGSDESCPGTFEPSSGIYSLPVISPPRLWKLLANYRKDRWRALPNLGAQGLFTLTYDFHRRNRVYVRERDPGGQEVAEGQVTAVDENSDRHGKATEADPRVLPTWRLPLLSGIQGSWTLVYTRLPHE